MNELKKEDMGYWSDIAGVYSGVAVGLAMTAMPYVGLDITDKEAVEKIIA